MVGAEALREIELPLAIEAAELPEEELRWCTVRLQEVFDKGNRLEASVFDIEGKHAREVLKQCKWPLTVFAGGKGLSDCYHRGRFKRIWVEKSDLPIFQPSQIEEIKPKPTDFLSRLTRTDIDALRVHRGQILLTCSGTIGNCSFVGKTLDKQIFSHDLIRITAKKETDAGFLYAFLRTKVGNALVRTNQYGAVVKHIEPEHLEDIPIPNPPDALKKKIHGLIIKSYDLRDESNALLDKAEALLYEALDLPPLDRLRPRYFDGSAGLRNYSVKLSKIDGRLDGSYHVPIVESIIKQLNKGAAEVTSIGDPRICSRVILPGRFARVYVEQGQGAIYFTGKHILSLDPSDKKYLAFARHAGRIKEELTIQKNMILITCSGTLAKVVLVPEHWHGWTMTHDIIRIVPKDENIAGFLWVFLASDYGKELIMRFKYGSVVDHIEDAHILQTPIPLLKDTVTQKKINDMASEANRRRTEAYRLEQEALYAMNEEVIHRSKS